MIRIDAAIALFPFESLSLTDIAMQSGFQSIPSFNRVFKSLKGITPSEYRNLNKVQ
jgi:AraC-like DNA-binding protein